MMPKPPFETSNQFEVFVSNPLKYGPGGASAAAREARARSTINAAAASRRPRGLVAVRSRPATRAGGKHA
jgi:hypothetical protein